MRSDPVGDRYVLDRAASRGLDRLATAEFGIPSIVLMENASRALAEAAMELIDQRSLRRVTIVAGTGANGGDGFACARHLVNAGRGEVRVAIVGDAERIGGDASVNLAILRAMEGAFGAPALCGPEEIGTLGRGDLIVDAIFGTGLDREVREPQAGVIRAINAARERSAGVLSADLPSGLDADTGEALGCAVRADRTVSFGAWKPGLLPRDRGAGRDVGRDLVRDVAGEVVIGGIGAPGGLIERLGVPRAGY